jgi:hypothetical protein
VNTLRHLLGQRVKGLSMHLPPGQGIGQRTFEHDVGAGANRASVEQGQRRGLRHVSLGVGLSRGPWFGPGPRH